jgi:CHAT domain-containing protein
LMQPIRVLLGETKTVFLSPDGALNLLPFGALVDENNQYLIKNYAFTYLSSGRDLLRLQAKIKSQDPGVIIGDVDFGAVDSGAAGNRSQATENNSEVLNRRSSTFVSGTFLPLPGTGMEVREINKIFPAAKVLTGKEATEGAIKRLNSPRILHVATHGFFLPNIKQDLRDARTFQSADGTVRLPVTENPLLRSGLALANANRLESDKEDGVLTALETSGLNLWGIRLVVLSACETGLGDVLNGEGVFGLRRTLVTAGSESQLMTLWKVDDLATKDLMVDYYHRLVSREGRSEALRQAQLAMLSNPKRQHPFYWASFIASGDWRQLD